MYIYISFVIVFRGDPATHPSRVHHNPSTPEHHKPVSSAELHPASKTQRHSLEHIQEGDSSDSKKLASQSYQKSILTVIALCEENIRLIDDPNVGDKFQEPLAKIKAIMNHIIADINKHDKTHLNVIDTINLSNASILLIESIWFASYDMEFSGKNQLETVKMNTIAITQEVLEHVHMNNYEQEQVIQFISKLQSEDIKDLKTSIEKTPRLNKFGENVARVLNDYMVTQWKMAIGVTRMKLLALSSEATNFPGLLKSGSIEAVKLTLTEFNKLDRIIGAYTYENSREDLAAAIAEVDIIQNEINKVSFAT